MQSTDVKNTYAENEPTSGSGLFLKLKDGDDVRMRILGLPAVYDNVFVDKDSKERTVSTKYAWPVYNFDAEKVQVMEGGATIYKALNSLIQDEDWGDPVKYDIKVARTGSGFSDTKYSVTPSPKSKELPKVLEDIDVVEISRKSDFHEDVHLLGEMFQPVKKDVVPEDIDEGGIDLSEIPF
jgi:hypothetical protein